MTLTFQTSCHCGHRWGIHKNGGHWGCTEPGCTCEKFYAEERRAADIDELADFISRANRPSLNDGGRRAETESWRWAAEAIIDAGWKR